MQNSTTIPQETLRRVRRIEITARRLVDELFAGWYHSTFKGRGMEFSEVREYQPGDDVRSIDWNVTARMGHPFVKKFIEERELTVLFVVDASGSQDFGSRGRLKSELAAEATAVLSYSALRNSDKVGLLLFSDKVEHYTPPRKTRGHALRIIRDVLTFRPAGRGTSLRAALEYLNRAQRRRAVVFLISDFMDEGYEKALRIAARRHDVVALPLSDPWESTPPKNIRMILEDAETGRVRTTSFHTHPRPATKILRGEMLEKTLRRFGADSVTLSTEGSYAEPFLKFFAQRAKRFR